jgi:hypothetical protein
MGEDSKAAVFVGTFLGNGQSVAVCDEHLVMFCASTLNTMTGIDPMVFIAAISEVEPELEVKIAGQPPDEPEEPEEPAPADPTPPTPLRGRMRAVSSEAPAATENGPVTTIADAGSSTSAG